MSLRGFVVFAVVLCALGFGWQQRDRLRNAVAPSTITVITPRDAEPPADTRPAGNAVATPKASAFRTGELRKCVKGSQVSYSNVECPAGSKEQAVTAGAVNVVPATPVAKPVVPQAPGSSAPSALHEALGLTRDDQLAEKIRQRAIEGATR